MALNEWLPGSREKELALTLCEQSTFWANATVARRIKEADN
ncbi:hypothetical protein SRB5_15880 [Streptomyces sp. RB5]|uniref:Uncharacterized protein n=1 Tax=Streptomyces smaragdinus TaxID=2585196 RepID=A0A7K0CDC8_9ACTN|nr:hypothetical protein [Streptomyces smaragdinus]MQY11470.1 hypothetical protein [Streptomyces smaragdinus]